MIKITKYSQLHNVEFCTFNSHNHSVLFSTSKDRPLLGISFDIVDEDYRFNEELLERTDISKEVLLEIYEKYMTWYVKHLEYRLKAAIDRLGGIK